MLRPAKEILEEHLPFGMLMRPAVIHAINTAREEAIKECAKKAKVKPFIFSKEMRERKCPAKVYAVLDSSSILSLIDELK